MSTGSCEAGNCPLQGDQVEGTTRSMTLCENHRHLVDFTPERHARWQRIAELVLDRFHPTRALEPGQSDVTHVVEADDDRTLAVRFRNDEGNLTIIVYHAEFGLAWADLRGNSDFQIDNEPILADPGSDVDRELQDPDRRVTVRELFPRFG